MKRPMRARFVVDDESWTRFEIRLRNLSPVAKDKTRKAMHRIADRIVKKAREYSPEDTGALVNSIRAEVVYQGPAGRKRLQIDITLAGAEHQLVFASGKMMRVTEYAEIIHERYEQVITKPGDKTLEKMAANPGKVGSRFLSRAYEEETDKLREQLIQSVSAAIKEVGL